jgi:hypothetical protein
MWGAAGVWSGKKEDERQTHRGEESSAHAPRRRRRQRRYNLELCTGGMWQYHGYVLRAPWATHGMGTAYAYVENAERASGTPASAHVPRWKGERRVCAGPGVPRGKDTRDNVSRSGRRVLLFSVFGFVGFVRSLRRRRPFFLGLLPAHEVGSFLPPFAPLSWDLYDPRS